MKTLEEIIARNDYKKINTVLKDRVNELAGAVRRKMNQLEEEEIFSNGILLSTRVARANSGYSVEYLAIEEDGCYNSLEHQFERYVAGDFTARIGAASNASYLNFLNNAREIFEELDELEDQKCASYQEALAKASVV